MPSLRERKKEEIRKNILAAAFQVFGTQGYAQTTVADIAVQANTAVGTCYNYFPSKAHLFYESILLEREDVWNQIENFNTDMMDDPSDMIMVLADLTIEFFRPLDKQFLQEVLFVMLEVIVRENAPPNIVINKLMERRYDVLAECKRRKLLPEDLDIRETIICLFSILLVQLVGYALNEDMTMDELYDSLDKKVRLFFQGKTLPIG